jgi:ankyrin repeat protein
MNGFTLNRVFTIRSITTSTRRVASKGFVLLLLGCSSVSSQAEAQAPAKVDFEKDVLPLFRENCVECHGTAKQKAGLRLDRKSSALKAFSRRVVPGSSENSMVYHRLIGNEYGTQMPPTAELRPEKVSIIKTWIDQGADWPEALANEADLPPPNSKAVAMIDMLQRGELSAFVAAAEADPSLLNARGPEGSTPFMYAVLYADTATLARLLKLGADPNCHNDANATALIWAARDLKKTRLLVRHGADVNARSDEKRTPLMIASRRPGGAPIVRFLLDHGANPNPNNKPVGESSPLMEALTAGDDQTAELLIRRGAEAKAVADQGLFLAVMMKCSKSFDLLAAQITDTNAYTIALGFTTVFGDLKATRLMLDRGASVNAVDPFGRTPLMYAVISDVLPVDVVELLIERGADVNARDTHTKAGDAGLTVLDIARLNGETSIVKLLEKHGAKGSTPASVALKPRRDNTIRKAVQDSIPLLQQVDFNFTKTAGCASCHNNSMEAMAIGLARTRGLRIDEAGAAAQTKVYLEELRARRDVLRQGYFAIPVGDMFSEFVLGYQLVGLHAQHCPPDLNTDAAAMLIQARQQPNGEWLYPLADTRPPICLDHIGQTALSMRALQLYAPKTEKAAYERSVRRAAAWLAKEKSYSNEDRAWRLTGLAWAGTDKAAARQALQELLATQRPDGGWSDLPTMQSTPYATGRSLVALQLGGLPVSDAAYQRGVQFLLKTQQEDGSWYTRTRALAFQPYFDSGFPHHYDQWMSAAATSWATMALALALPEGGPLTASASP